MKPIDLSLTVSSRLPSFPGSPKPLFLPWSKMKTDGYNLEMLFFSSHTGTHIDAPFHFSDSGFKIHQIPLDRLFINARLARIHKGPNQSITKTDLQQFEKKFGDILPNSTLVIETGWQKNLKKSYFFETNPGLSLSAAKYLITKKINLVGIDSPSIDLGSDSNFSVHKEFARKNILIVENLTNLDRLRKISFTLIILPLKLKDASGSPVRAIAF